MFFFCFKSHIEFRNAIFKKIIIILDTLLSETLQFLPGLITMIGT